VLIDHEWTIESGELTASLKLRRKFICQKYDAVTRLIFNIDSDD